VTVVRSSAFDHRVEVWVLERLSDRPMSFGELLARLPGVYPSVAIDASRRLAHAGLISFDTLEAFQNETSLARPELPATRSLLPLPHPLDFEWRFTAGSSRRLLDLAADLSDPDSPILLFGTPGIAIEALSLPLDRLTTFIGEDNVVTGRVAALNRAVGAPLSVRLCSAGLPTCLAGVVILDPPWYLDFVRPMLAAAAGACHLSGFVLASLPPEGAQMSAINDREKVVRFATRLGLKLIAEHALILEYDTPFFEANALAVAGIRVPQAWRRGDLVIFEKVRETNRPISTASIRKERWSEVSIGRTRLFVRRDKARLPGSQGLIPIVPGDILPTVSRRDPRRRDAEIWTSGNRVFATDHPELVITAALSLGDVEKHSGAQPQLWDMIADHDAVERVAHELRALAAREAAEERAVWPTGAVGWGVACTSNSARSLNELTVMASG
jgi:hypothetical protein